MYAAPRRLDMMQTLLVLVSWLNELGNGKDRHLPELAIIPHDSGNPRLRLLLFSAPFFFRSAFQARLSVSWLPRGKREGWIAISTIYAHWHDPITDICVRSQTPNVFFQK